jgi:hypothetical protein
MPATQRISEALNIRLGQVAAALRAGQHDPRPQGQAPRGTAAPGPVL